MKRISRKVREEAIEACLCRADNLLSSSRWDDEAPRNKLAAMALHAVSIGAHLDEPHVARELAFLYLEAAALLRDGWSPGDPVRLLRGES